MTDYARIQANEAKRGRETEGQTILETDGDRESAKEREREREEHKAKQKVELIGK